MIKTMQLTHYLDEKIYAELCNLYGFNIDQRISNNNERSASDASNPLRKITMFHIEYEVFGHLWFFTTEIDLSLLYGFPHDKLAPADKISYQSFLDLLSKLYTKEFGAEIAGSIPYKEGTICDYAAYMVYIRNIHADDLMKKLAAGKFEKEQLDINCFDSFKLRNSTAWFTVNKLDDTTVRLTAKCQRTALKSLIKTQAKGCDGVPVADALKKENAVRVLSRQVIKYTRPDIPVELGEAAIIENMR